MRNGRFKPLMACLVLLLPAALFAQERAWIEESNRHAQVLLEILARYAPEFAASIGVEGHDEDVFDITPGYVDRLMADLEGAAEKLSAVRDEVTDPRVRQDLDILIQAARDRRESAALEHRLMLPYFNLPEQLFSGFQDLLDPRVAKSRYPAALVRLRRYIGAEKGFEPVAHLARDRFRERAVDETLVGPWVKEVEQHLEHQHQYLEGIEKLLKESGLKGWQRDLRTLRRQMDEYAKWVRAEVLPRARPTNRLPPEIYADNLKNYGVKMSPEELIERALAAYVQTREEMATIARIVAERRKLPSADYRDVIRELKKERIGKERILETYRSKLAVIEDIVRKEDIVALPDREAKIRLATEAESLSTPAPHIDPPRLIGNTGEPAEFVLPTSNPRADSSAEMDDFTYEGIAWTLTAHEARPGHELQFASMLEQGVSTARIVFAFNSANVEGWALYAEALMKKYLPPEGQLGTLQMRLMRAARAFLDPMLNLGMITPEEAKRVLMEEVVLSEPMAKQEVDRYTMDSPGQATAYFYGYMKLSAIRARAELALGEAFRERSYHDFILNQGLLPLDALERAVLESYVPAQKAR